MMVNASRPEDTIKLDLQGAFPSEEALREMVRRRRICFEHEPFYVRDASGEIVQLGFQLSLYAAFADPRHLPVGDDQEWREIAGELRRLCRVFFQTLRVLKPCERPDPPEPEVVFSPARRMRAEVCLRIPIFDQAHFGTRPGRQLHEVLATAVCLLKTLGARPGAWEEGRPTGDVSSDPCDRHAREAAAQDSTEP